MGEPLELYPGIFADPSWQARFFVVSRSGDLGGRRLPGQEPEGGWERRTYWELGMREQC